MNHDELGDLRLTPNQEAAIVASLGLPLYEELNAAFLRWLEEGALPASTGVRWLPTHVVPIAGMSAWATPDPASPVVANLEPGLPVQVAEAAGAWARVIASNGWTGWVDGRLLVPRP